MKRDLRVDFFRGVALTIMLWGHLIAFSGIESRVLRLTPGSIGFSDVSEWFVFLAGFICGIVYGKAFEDGGFRVVQQKAAYRALQIYVANFVCFLLAIAAVALFHSLLGTSFGRIELAFTAPMETIPRAAALIYTPYGFNILPLYIVLLLAMPTVMWFMYKHMGFALGLSALLYVVVQFYPQINMPRYGGLYDWWTFNPFAWQFIFFLAMALGIRARQGKAGVPRYTPLVVIAALYMLFGPAVRVSTILAKHELLLLGPWYETLSAIDVPHLGQAKVNQDLHRLTHFLASAYLANVCLRRDHPFWSSTVAAPVILWGQYSLPVYCIHAVLLYVFSPLMEYFDGGLILFVFSFFTAAAIITIAISLTRRRKEARLANAARSA